MPFSVFLMSLSQFFLATNWLLELDFRNKWERLKSNKPALYLIGLFLLHLLWMINSENMDYGWHDIRIKLPLFVLALLIGSSKRLVWKELEIILNVFIAAIVSSSLFSASIYYGIIDREFTDVREISIFISHIRLSLLVNMGVFLSYFLAKKSNLILYKLFYSIAIVWLVFFLFILNAYTGILVFIIVFMFLLLQSIFKYKNIWVKVSAFLSVFILLVSFTYISIQYINRFYKFDKMQEGKIPISYTINGNPYENNKKLFQKENGHFVYLNFCSKELEKEWNTRSSIDFIEGKNAKGSRIKFTLMHYLTSLNLKKDSVGVATLSNEDIKMIEKGYSNYIYKNKYSPYVKIYPLLQQMQYYFESGYANGASVAQRVEYLKIAKRIIENNFWLGTGTGDVDDAFKQHYLNKESTLSIEFQHRAHNQYLTFLISFGIFGFILSVFFMFAPLYKERKQFLPLVYVFIAFLSMLNEDTLETQAGITFFIFFYALFFIAFSFEDTKKGYTIM